MDSTLRVREANDSDRDLLMGFHESLYRQHRDRVVPEAQLPLIEYRDYDQILRDDVQTLLSAPNAFVLIAELHEGPVGYITGRVNVEPQRVLPRRGVIEDWYVAPASRGRGVGGMLLRELEKRFRGAGCQLVESATWSGNEDARRAHDALGFEEIRVTYRKRL